MRGERGSCIICREEKSRWKGSGGQREGNSINYACTLITNIHLIEV